MKIIRLVILNNLFRRNYERHSAGTYLASLGLVQFHVVPFELLVPTRSNVTVVELIPVDTLTPIVPVLAVEVHERVVIPIVPVLTPAQGA